ncbi:MAG: hypothetical protein LQ351_000923 [Letrouitia transgressa]|nr:MAG: hypothetical protein LQ351_000923 [Letrouitia transgressa]
MADAPAASPASNADSAKKPAVKDSKCPFCGTFFTSSSLGRHLDLWIKEKNPKAPDDVHNIEEIRKLRGNVTRRQARSNVARRDGSTPSSSKPTPIRDQRSPSDALYSSTVDATEGGPFRTNVNRPNWQATGVINGLPPFSREGLSQVDGKRNVPKSSVKSEIVRKQHALEESDRALAAELALKEVLESVRAANLRAHPPTPFDFDFFSLTFPGLCLRCLPPPRSFSPRQSFQGQDTWPLEPPGNTEHECMKRWIFAKLQEWKVLVGQLDRVQQNGGGEGNPPWTFDLAKEESVYHDHFKSAYDEWRTLSAEKQQLDWRFECQKAFAQEQDRHRETADRLDKLEQELHSLRGQIAHPGAGAWAASTPPTSKPATSSMTALPPSTLHISRRTTDNLNSLHSNLGAQTWDYDSLIEKWKTRILRERSVQRSLPQAPWPPNTPTTNGASPFLQQQQHHHHQHHQEPPPPAEEDEDEDLVDAPGEDEEDIPSIIDREMLDPKLRDRGSFNTNTNGNGVVDDDAEEGGE